ncbi:hypothetical protein OV320_2621 [Actinobacteria bacterium OV320]|nr:hypothetical protein OV320_2621 [Actinobacteria bacterium OV320]
MKTLDFESPYGCRWCGTQRWHHGRRWKPVVGLHAWEVPSEALILERMTRRRADRLAALPQVFHATTGWAADGTGESADPYCADCKRDGCPRWARIQTRLDQQRHGLPRRFRRRRKAPAGAGGWGGNSTWPF